MAEDRRLTYIGEETGAQISCFDSTGINEDADRALAVLSEDRRFGFYLLSHVPELGAVSIEGMLNRGAGYPLNDRQRQGLHMALDCINGLREGYESLRERGIRMVTAEDDDYPRRLNNIAGRPMVLYVKGDLPPDDLPAAAVVGSRTGTNYGISVTDYMAETLSGEGVSIISGMAHGIDAAAHRGALRTPRGRSYAVLGSGVDICYPRENYELYEAMSEGGRGGVISETVPGMNPLKKNFPMRNRIISGLSDVVMVMEARERSGSLITAGLALDQGRDVLALPGRVTDPLSRGCNTLIAQGARILTSPSDVTEILGIIMQGTLPVRRKKYEDLSREEQILYDCLDTTPGYIQDITDRSGMPRETVISLLLGLELKGYISQVSAGYYAVC